MSQIEERVIEKIRQRAAKGEGKYGVTMERSDLTLLDWLAHLQEELLDAAIYIEKVFSIRETIILSAPASSIHFRETDDGDLRS